MCTSIIEVTRAEGMAKRGDQWFPLTQAVVAYDHARHAQKEQGRLVGLQIEMRHQLLPSAKTG